MSRTAKPFVVTHQSVIAIAWPTTLAYLSTPLLGLVDTAVVGRFGDAALLGGLAVGAILFDIIFTTFNFLRSSTTGLVAQAMGADRPDEQNVVLVRSLLISVALGFITLIFAPLILTAGLWFMDVPERVAEATRAYFTIRILAAPLTLINYSVLGWLLGQAEARLGLLLQTVLNGTNIGLSVMLGLVWDMGIEGVAWATVLAELVAVLLGLVIVYRRLSQHFQWQWHVLLDRPSLIQLFAVNFDIMVRSFCLLFAFAYFASKGADLGENTLAANAVLMNFFLISGYFLDGFATAAEQLAGRALGARNRPAFETAVRLTLIWGFILAGLATLVFLLLGPWLIDLLTTSQEIRSVAREYLFWAAITALVGVVAFQMDGVFIGATWSNDMRNMMLISLAFFLVTCWIAMPQFGNHGLWFALEVFLGIRGITLFIRLRQRIGPAFQSKDT